MIDAAWQPYRAELLVRAGQTDAALDATATIASAASAATAGVAAKVLSVLSSAASGSKSAIDNDVLLKSSIANIIHQMDTDRSKIWAGLLLSEQLPVSAYPMRDAASDLLAYFDAGTMVDGLENLDSNTSAATQPCQTAGRAVIAAVKAADTLKNMPVGRSASGSAAAAAVTDKTVTSAAGLGQNGTTDADQCQQLQQKAQAIYDVAEPDSSDLATLKGNVAKHIQSIGPSQEPMMHAIATALEIEPTEALGTAAAKTYSDERAVLLAFFGKLTSGADVRSALARVMARTGQDLNQ